MDNTIKQAEGQIKSAQAALELARLLPDLSELNFPTDERYFGASDAGLICITLPYSTDCYRRFRRLLGKGWSVGRWWFTQHSTDNNMVRSVTICRDGFTSARLMVSLDPTLDKSTCSVQQIGVKEIPIMEVICNQPK